MSDTRPQNNKPRENTAAQATASAGHQGAQAAEQNGRATAEALRQSGETAAELARRAGETGAETLRRSTEAMAESHRHIAQESAERLQGVSRVVAETARGTAEDVRALISLPTVADRGLRDFHQSMTGLFEGVLQANLRATEEILRLTSPAAFLGIQQRFAREYMNTVMEGSAALVRAVRHTVDQTLPPLEQHLRERHRADASFGSQGNKTYQTAAE